MLFPNLSHLWVRVKAIGRCAVSGLLELGSCLTRPLLFFALLGLAVPLLLLSCAHQGQWAGAVRWKAFASEEVPRQNKYPDASALILLDEAEMDVLSGSELPLSIFERHRVVKILSRRGLRYANVVIPYDPKSQVEKIEARTISPDGKITVLDPEDIYDVSLYPEYIWYSDQRAKIFALPNAGVGSVLEYHYTMTIGSLTFWHSWVFQEQDPVLVSRFKLVSPAEWDVEYRVYGLDVKPRIQKAPKGFRSTYVWEARDVAPLKTEMGMPPARECVARLAMAPAGMKSWNDVGRWYSQLATPQMRADEEIRQLARRLTQGTRNDREKLRRLYEWVRDQVRYVAVEIGIGGFQPHAATEVLRHRYGDCKDMVTLLCTLGQVAGLDVRQAILSTWQNGLPDTSLHSQLQFNHVIAVARTADSSTVWMDPTEKGCPFGKLPWYDQGLPALVVDRKGRGQLVDTPVQPADSNRVELIWSVELDSSGAAHVRGTMHLVGAQASELREQFQVMSDEAKRQWLEISLASRCSGAELQDFSFGGLDPVEDPLRLDYTFTTTTFARRVAGGLAIYPGDITGFDLPELFRARQRSHPVRFRFGSRTALRVSIHLPSGYAFADSCFLESVTSEFGEAHWHWWVAGETLHVTQTYKLFGQDVDPTAYGRFRDFLEAVRMRNLKPLLLLEAGRRAPARTAWIAKPAAATRADPMASLLRPTECPERAKEKGYSILSIPSAGGETTPSLASCRKR